jgi:hypothetical protein
LDQRDSLRELEDRYEECKAHTKRGADRLATLRKREIRAYGSLEKAKEEIAAASTEPIQPMLGLSTEKSVALERRSGQVTTYDRCKYLSEDVLVKVYPERLRDCFAAELAALTYDLRSPCSQAQVSGDVLALT